MFCVRSSISRSPPRQALLSLRLLVFQVFFYGLEVAFGLGWNGTFFLCEGPVRLSIFGLLLLIFFGFVVFHNMTGCRLRTVAKEPGFPRVPIRTNVVEFHVLYEVTSMRCPICTRSFYAPLVAQGAIENEIRFREQFVNSRLGRKASRAELKDLTDFMHGFAAPLYVCRLCGLLIRAEHKVRGAAAYGDDANDLDIMSVLLPRYVQAFRNKAAGFRDLLRPHAEVLELGSHLGAFLQVGEEWNWRPTGFDVGTDTADFARRKGFTVRRTTLEEAQPPSQTYEAVFIWNCFEQLADPVPVLRAAHRVLRRHGLLVIRVPNASFYLDGRTMRNSTTLAWNNLLGFPYLFGYTAELVTRLVMRWGFEPVCGFNSELVTMPFPDLTSRLAAEQKAVSGKVAVRSTAASARSHELTGPWIEIVYRKVSKPVAGRPNIVAPEFLARAA